MVRDVLSQDPSAAGTLSQVEVAGLISNQTDVLADIRRELMKQNPEVLCTTVVQGGNVIQEANRNYKVFFEVGGKQVPIYALLAYSTLAGATAQVALSVNSMSVFEDGIPFVAGDVLYQSLTVDSMYIMLAGTGTIVNGPATTDEGAFYLYGWTIPDYDRNKGNLR
jgi:hypothetical protein